MCFVKMFYTDKTKKTNVPTVKIYYYLFFHVFMLIPLSIFYHYLIHTQVTGVLEPIQVASLM